MLMRRANTTTSVFDIVAHVITGPDGAFRFRIIVPALYPGRTRHYHVKV
jgi:protocatechuate 3,4-dioxygenase beta subunit